MAFRGDHMWELFFRARWGEFYAFFAQAIRRWLCKSFR